jgi:hypothetical protein
LEVYLYTITKEWVIYILMAYWTTGRHVASLRCDILIPSQAIFILPH